MTGQRGPSPQASSDGETCGEDPGSYRYVIGYGYDVEEAKAFRDAMLDMLRELCGLEELKVL